MRSIQAIFAFSFSLLVESVKAEGWRLVVAWLMALAIPVVLTLFVRGLVGSRVTSKGRQTAMSAALVLPIVGLSLFLGSVVFRAFRDRRHRRVFFGDPNRLHEGQLSLPASR